MEKEVNREAGGIVYFRSGALIPTGGCGGGQPHLRCESNRKRCKCEVSAALWRGGARPGGDAGFVGCSQAVAAHLCPSLDPEKSSLSWVGVTMLRLFRGIQVLQRDP